MSDAKFTGGEWKVADGTQIGEQILFIHNPELKSKGKVICRLTRVVDTHIPLSEQDIANAHLIAAAPEMYAMLEAAQKEIANLIDEVNDQRLSRVNSSSETQPDLCDQETVHEIQKLLSKARGEQ